MPQLSPQQIAQVSYNAGFRGQSLINAIAIALAESGGNPSAYNPELAAGTRPGSGSRGIFQIYGQAHPEYNSSLMFDPNANAQAAYKVYQQAGGRFTPWSTLNQGSYKQYLGLAQSAAAQLTGASGGSSVSINTATNPALQGAVGSANGIQASNPILQALGLPGPLRINWSMLLSDTAFIIGGGALLLIGLVMIFISILEATPEPIKQAAGTAIKTAAIA